MQAFAAVAFIGAFAARAAALPSAPRGPDGREPVRRAQGAASARTAVALVGQSPRPNQVMSGSGVAFALRLYASVGRLAPGDYLLRWQVRGLDGGALQGEVPFAVAADRPSR